MQCLGWLEDTGIERSLSGLAGAGMMAARLGTISTAEALITLVEVFEIGSRVFLCLCGRGSESLARQARAGGFLCFDKWLSPASRSIYSARAAPVP